MSIPSPPLPRSIMGMPMAMPYRILAPNRGRRELQIGEKIVQLARNFCPISIGKSIYMEVRSLLELV